MDWKLYTTGTHALPDIYAQARGPQAKHSSLWYKYNMYGSYTLISVNLYITIHNSYCNIISPSCSTITEVHYTSIPLINLLLT